MPEPSNNPKPDPNRTLSNLPPDTSRSPVVGPYKLLKKIGEGGMGEVWMAEQEFPVRRRVALKLIKQGLDNKQILARFEAERQALAMMEHQNIAKVLDAGSTDQKQPYFVMELVRGIPITKYCDQHKLSIDERLELFIPVCNAIQHAHQKGIIHRDLKPSNVLVCLFDGKPVPKVIDFGLAKAFHEQTRLTERTMFTEFGQVVGTLQYMSPEQAEMNQLDIDTRTDIYSLGVMLYELLTGSTPIEKETLKQQAFMQVLESIRLLEPQRPSVRLSSVNNEAANNISLQRQIELEKLKNILRGELDWIVMKALEKDRTRRYESASGFADDLNRYLAGDVVMARPPSTGYRFKKYFRRNKGLVLSLSSIALLMTLLLFGSIWGMYRFNQLAKEKTAEALKASEATEDAEDATEDAKADRKKAEEALARSNYFLANARWNENRADDARALLEQISEPFRNFEWYLDQKLYEGSDATFFGHSGPVSGVDFNPDGTQVISTSYDKSLKVWNVNSGKEIKNFGQYRDVLSCISCSNDGLWMVAGSWDGSLILWNNSTGENRVLKEHSEKVTCITFDRDGKRMVSGSKDGTVRLWDVANGKVLNKIPKSSGEVNSVCFSPDGTLIAFGNSYGAIKLLTNETGEQKSLKEHTDSVNSIQFSPDGKQMVSGSKDKTLKLWNPKTGDLLQTLDEHTDQVNCVSFSPDGTRIISGSDDNTLRLWDVFSGKVLRTLNGHFGGILCIKFSPDGTRVISGSYDSSLKFWDITTGSDLQTLNGHTQIVSSVDFSPDGKRIISGSEDNILRLWDTETGEELRSISGPTDLRHPVCVCFDPTGKLIVSGDADKKVRIRNAQTGKLHRELEDHSERVTCVTISPDGTTIASGSEDKTAILWNAETGAKLHSLDHILGVKCVAFSPDNAQVVSGSAKNLKLWNARTGEETGTCIGHSDVVECVKFSPDGSKIVSGSSDSSLKLWDARSEQLIQTFNGHTDSVTSVSFSRDGSRIVSGSRDGTLKLWDVEKGLELRTLRQHAGQVTCVSFNRDGNRIVSGGSDKTLKLLSSSMEQELRLLSGHQDYVRIVSISSNGQMIISGSRDNVLKVWDRKSGENRTLSGHSGPVISLGFDSNGTKVVSENRYSEKTVWNASTGERLNDQNLPNSSSAVNQTKLVEDGARWLVIRGDDAESNTKSADGRWLVIPMGKEVGVVDLHFKNRPHVQALLQRFARIKMPWHREQAKTFEEANNWFAATFHRAWALKANPGSEEDQRELKSAYEKLVIQDQTENRQDAHLLPPLVREMIEITINKK